MNKFVKLKSECFNLFDINSFLLFKNQKCVCGFYLDKIESECLKFHLYFLLPSNLYLLMRSDFPFPPMGLY